MYVLNATSLEFLSKVSLQLLRVELLRKVSLQLLHVLNLRVRFSCICYSYLS